MNERRIRGRHELEAFLSSPLSEFAAWDHEGRNPQSQFLRGAADYRTRLFRAGNQSGKLAPPMEPVLTPEGWRPIGGLRIDDEVISGTGERARVVGVYKQPRQPMWRLTFDDGASTTVGGPHLWKCKDRTRRFRKAHKEYGNWTVLSTDEIRERWGLEPKPVQRISIPTMCAQHPGFPVPVDPYILGVLIGDGGISTGSVNVTTGDPEILDAIRELVPGCDVVHANRYSWRVNKCKALKDGLKQLGLWGKRAWEKYVPGQYMFNSPAVRLATLQGLLDTDGHVDEMGHIEYSTTSERLAQNVVDLVRSLGGKSHKVPRQTHYTYKGERRAGRPSWRIHVRLPQMQPVRLPRHIARLHRPTSTTDERVLHKIEPAGEDVGVCIQVDHPDQTYVTKDYIVTHNTTVGAVDVLLHVLGWHPWGIFRPPVHWWVSGLDYDWGIGQIIWPTMAEFMPWDQIQGGEDGISWLKKRHPSVPLSIKFKNGSTIVFKSADQGRRKFQGARLHGWWADEEHPSDVVQEGRARLVKHGGYFNVTLTPIQREAWVRQLEREDDVLVVRASMLDAAKAGCIDVEAATRFLDGLPERERRVREKGDQVSLEGLVWPQYDEETHTVVPHNGHLWCDGDPIAPWPLPDHWARWSSMDFGMTNPACNIEAVLDPVHERFIVTRCRYASGIPPSDWGKHLKRVLPDLEKPLICDHDAGDRAELEKAGVPTCAAWKRGKDNVRQGLRVVERWFYARCDDGHPKLVLVKDPTVKEPLVGRCDGMGGDPTKGDTRGLAWEVEGYHWAEGKDAPAPKQADHACFAGDTLVATPWGPRRIDAIRGGDVVETPEGPQKVLGASLTRYNALVQTVHLPTVSVTCTPDHRFLVRPETMEPLKAAGWKHGEWCEAENMLGSVADWRRVDVYCISVPCRAFLLADGWVAANCDALRYLVTKYERHMHRLGTGEVSWKPAGGMGRRGRRNAKRGRW